MATNIPGVMFRCVVAPDGSTGFTYISERCMDILGIENDTDTFSEHLTENIIPEDRERFLTSIQEAITNRSLWRFEGRYHKPGCDTIWMKAISSPVIDGSVYIFDGIIFDDTAWKRLDEYNRILAHMLDHAPAAITIHDYDGKFLYANEETFTLHGYSRDEFLTLNLHDLDVPESAALISERMSSLRENSFTEFSVEHFRKNQTRIPLRVCVKPISWEGRNVQLSVATDLTEQRRFEQALHDANLKIRLLMSLTRHDIINHLMVMRGALFLAQDETDLGVLNDCISRAIQAGEKIGKVIEFTREYEMTGLSASGWVNARTMVEWAGKEVSLGEIRLMNEIPGDIEIYSDAIITRVFASIIENAVRHGGTVTRIICSSLITGSRLTLICEDDGEGIPPEEKELIFENGYGKNTGFGLFLSRELLSVTGFCVQETGEHRSGARFEIQVPSDKFRILPAG